MNTTIRPLALRIPDAVHYSGLSRSTLYKMEAEGKLKMVRVGGRTLISIQEIERILGFRSDES